MLKNINININGYEFNIDVVYTILPHKIFIIESVTLIDEVENEHNLDFMIEAIEEDIINVLEQEHKND